MGEALYSALKRLHIRSRGLGATSPIFLENLLLKTVRLAPDICNRMPATCRLLLAAYFNSASLEDAMLAASVAGFSFWICS